MSGETFTVGDFKRTLHGLPDDIKVSFAGGLTIYRIKRVSDDEVFVEFNEPQGDLTDAFKKRDPHVRVVFIGIENTQWTGSDLVGSLNVTVR